MGTWSRRLVSPLAPLKWLLRLYAPRGIEKATRMNSSEWSGDEVQSRRHALSSSGVEGKNRFRRLKTQIPLYSTLFVATELLRACGSIALFSAFGVNDGRCQVGALHRSTRELAPRELAHLTCG